MFAPAWDFPRRYYIGPDQLWVAQSFVETRGWVLASQVQDQQSTTTSDPLQKEAKVGFRTLSDTFPWEGSLAKSAPTRGEFSGCWITAAWTPPTHRLTAANRLRDDRAAEPKSGPSCHVRYRPTYVLQELQEEQSSDQLPEAPA